MSRSYKDDVSPSNKEQSTKKQKRQFNKKVRQNSKKILNDYVLGGIVEKDLEILQDIEEDVE